MGYSSLILFILLTLYMTFTHSVVASTTTTAKLPLDANFSKSVPSTDPPAYPNTSYSSEVTQKATVFNNSSSKPNNATSLLQNLLSMIENIANSTGNSSTSLPQTSLPGGQQNFPLGMQNIPGPLLGLLLGGTQNTSSEIQNIAEVINRLLGGTQNKSGGLLGSLLGGMQNIPEVINRLLGLAQNDSRGIQNLLEMIQKFAEDMQSNPGDIQTIQEVLQKFWGLAQNIYGGNQNIAEMIQNIPEVIQKLLGGTKNSMLSQMMVGKQLDLKSVFSLFTGGAKELPSLVKGALTLNTSSLPDLTRICYEDLNTYTDDLSSLKVWTLKMLDASGKLAPSIFDGNLQFFGNYDECLEIESGISTTTGRSVHGDTCVVHISPPPEQLSGLMGIPLEAASAISISWHMCLPNTCSGPDIKTAFTKGLSKLNITVSSVVCHADIKPGPIGEDPTAVGAIVLIAILGFLVLLGSLLDLDIRARKGREAKEPTTPNIDATKLHDICNRLASEDSHKVEMSLTNGKHFGLEENGSEVKTSETSMAPNGIQVGQEYEKDQPKHKSKSVKPPVWQRLLLCFSAVTNGEKILSVKHAPGTLTCLNGVRVLSICWVIIGHTFLFFVGNADNPLTANKLKNRFMFQIIASGTLSVDSFFVLSGLLATYLFLRETQKAGGIRAKHMVLYYVHRYLRLTPVYAFTIFVYTFLMAYLADGPQFGGPADKSACEQNWWANILYINNFYKTDQQCAGWGWYLANDMQFYIVAPLALVPLALGQRRGIGVIMKTVGLCVTGAFLLTSIISSAVITYYNSGDTLHNGIGYFQHVYQKPWCRIGPFAIGMGLGYILHATKSKIRMSVFVQSVGWFLALVAGLACLFTFYDENAPGRSVWAPIPMAVHQSLFRSGWGLVLGWVILMCCTDKGGIINWILSWDWWQPLARLTYGAYLVHLIIIGVLNLGTAKSLIHFTAGYMVLHFFGYVCLSYITSFVLAILVEAPFMRLERMLLP